MDKSKHSGRKAKVGLRTKSWIGGWRGGALAVILLTTSAGSWARDKKSTVDLTPASSYKFHDDRFIGRELNFIKTEKWPFKVVLNGIEYDVQGTATFPDIENKGGVATLKNGNEIIKLLTKNEIKNGLEIDIIVDALSFFNGVSSDYLCSAPSVTSDGLGRFVNAVGSKYVSQKGSDESVLKDIRLAWRIRTDSFLFEQIVPASKVSCSFDNSEILIRWKGVNTSKCSISVERGNGSC